MCVLFVRQLPRHQFLCVTDVFRALCRQSVVHASKIVGPFFPERAKAQGSLLVLFPPGFDGKRVGEIILR